MATDVERLVVSLEASVTKFDRAMAKASGASDAAARKIERRFDGMQRRLSSTFSGLEKGLVAAFAAAASLRGAQQLIDASTRIQNSLKVAGLAGEELSAVYDSLFASAQRNAAPLESLVTLYSRISLVQNELGASTEELLGFTDNIALALRVAGTDAEAASGALLQLSQALGGGTVRAEEFNSIQEGALPVLQAVAAGLEEAGGSVSKLRTLVIDGKLSSEAFFRSFEAGSVILNEKVANSELTVSNAFVRLINVLTDVAGKFNEGTGASQFLATALDTLGTRIGAVTEDFLTGEAPAIRFIDAIMDASRALGERVGADGIGDYLKSGQLQSDLDGLAASFDRFGPSVSDADLALAEAEQSLVNFATNTKGSLGEVDAAAQDLFQQVLEGKGSAELAAEAIKALGEANPDFSGLLGQIGAVIQRIYELRDAAITTSNMQYTTAPEGGGIAEQRAEQLGRRPRVVPKPQQITIADYPAGGVGGGGGSSGGGGGGQSASDRFNEALGEQRQRIAEMNREIDARNRLGVAFDEQGLAMERMRIQLELENEAAQAGLELTPARRQAIDELAAAYAQTSVELDRVTKAQEQMQQAAEDAAQAIQAGMRGFIDDLIEGKSATEALGNALKSIGGALLDTGLNALFGGLFGGGGFGGGGLRLGYQAGVPGFAAGTPNTGGARGQVRGLVHGQEAVIPLPNGGRVPVEMRMPTLPGGAGGEIRVTAEMRVENGNLVPIITEVSGRVGDRQIKANNRQLAALMRNANQRYG